MITALFVLTVVGALTLHYFFVERPRVAEVRATQPVPNAITLTEAMEELPRGVFLQPTFTWTRIRKNEELFLGVHPLLMSLVGSSHKLELQADESRLKKGDPLLDRTIKESVHELGHTFGLVHCFDAECVMSSSTYVEEVDLKADWYCPQCESGLAGF